MMYWSLKKHRPKLNKIILIVLGLALFSCTQKIEEIPNIEDKKAPPENPTPVVESITKTYKRGPVELEVFVDKNIITIADKLKLKIDVKADKKYFIDLPEWKDDPNQFTMIEVDEPTAKLLKDDRFHFQKSFILGPFLSGDYTIPPLTIKFWTEEEGEDNAHNLVTEPIKISVKSLLPENREDIKMVDIQDVVDPPPPDMTWLFFVIGGLALGAGITVGVICWFRYQKSKNKPIPTIAAHELAYDELRKLVSEKLVENGEFKLFYYRINDILRHYIENRFTVHAPEQTTEEFLADIQDKDILEKTLKTLLKEFMIHCDQVKFAKHQPSDDEIQNTFNSTKDFIQTTENIESRVVITESMEGGQE